MKPGILIPVLLLVVVIPVAFVWAKKTLRDAPAADEEIASNAPTARLTSNALRELPSPPWRVVYEIAGSKLDGVEHVLIGPPGTFAMRTSMDPLPDEPSGPPDAHAIAEASILRGRLDDSLARCAMSSDRLVIVHWGVVDPGRPAAVETLPGVIAVDGRRLQVWAASLRDQQLSPAQVDLAWQTVTTTIGRPDPLN